MTTRFSDKDWAEATGSAGPGGSMGSARPMRNPVTRQVLRPFATKAAPQPKLDRKQAKAELARERRRLLALMLALDLECRRLPKGLLLGVAAGGREAEKRHAASRSRNSMEVHLSPASRIVVNEARMAAKREHSLKTVHDAIVARCRMAELLELLRLGAGRIG